jgi:hypothetical protein
VVGGSIPLAPTIDSIHQRFLTIESGDRFVQ